MPLAASGCDLYDFGGVKPLAVFGRMASRVASENGRLTLSGRIGGMLGYPIASVAFTVE